MKVALLTIAKNEEKYLDEWVNYHFSVGFDHIFIVDNNDSDKKLSYMHDNVTVLPYNDAEIYQRSNKFIKTYVSTVEYIRRLGYDYLSILDLDEFITFENKGNSIREYIYTRMMQYGINLSEIQWKVYNDNNIIWEKDTKEGVIDTYEEEQTKFKYYCDDFMTEQFWFKPIVRLDKCEEFVMETYYKVKNSNFYRNFRESKDNAYIRHYTTKCLETYVKHKVVDNANNSVFLSPRRDIVKYYFIWNEITQEKLNAFRQLLNEYDLTQYIYSLDKIEKKFNKRFDVALLAMAKDEENFLEEWIEYHLSIGFKHIFIIDNNSSRKKLFVKNPNVSVFPYNDIPLIDRKDYQAKAYNLFIPTIINMGYDYLSVLDIDEYFTINSNKNICDFVLDEMVSKDVHGLNIGWYIYNDNGIIWEKDTKKSILETYTELQNKVQVYERNWLNDASLAKPIFDLSKYSYMYNEHTPSYDLKDCPRSKACIRHYMTKCLETYFVHKILSQNSHAQNIGNIRTAPFKFYFMFNEVTQEKIEAFRLLLKMHNCENLPTKELDELENDLKEKNEILNNSKETNTQLKDITNNKYKCAVFCIAKHVDTLEKWIKHNVDIGFDSVIVYSDKNIYNLDKKYKKLIFEHGNGSNNILTYVYKKYSNNYDWIAFIEDDEFITLDSGNISKFLSQKSLSKFECVRLCCNDTDKPYLRTIYATKNDVGTICDFAPHSDNSLTSCDSTGKYIDTHIINPKKPVTDLVRIVHNTFDHIEYHPTNETFSYEEVAVDNRIAVCCIAKMENHYIREWVEHYKSIGFDNVIICDNNYPDGERFEEVIADYIESGFVILEDYRMDKPCQSEAYTNSYKKYGNRFDWIAFFDVDEYLMLDCGNIKSLLSDVRMKDYGRIAICTHYYGDNGLLRVENGDYSLVNRFTKPSEKCQDYQVKSIERTKLEGALCKVHASTFKEQIKTCNSNYEETEHVGKYNEFISTPTHQNARLNHYMTKTIEEYVTIRQLRGDTFDNTKNNLEFFYRYNDETEEKTKLYKQLTQFNYD